MIELGLGLMFGIEVNGRETLPRVDEEVVTPAVMSVTVVSVEVVGIVAAAVSNHHDDDEEEVHIVTPSTGDAIAAATVNNSSQSNRRDEEGSPKGLKSTIHTRFFLSTYKSTEYLLTATKVSRIYFRLEVSWKQFRVNLQYENDGG